MPAIGDVVRYRASAARVAPRGQVTPNDRREEGMVTTFDDFNVRLTRADTLYLHCTVKLATKLTVTLGAPTAGTFTLTFRGKATAPIAYNAASSAVQLALEKLATIGAGNVTVTGAAGGPYSVVLSEELFADDPEAHLTGFGDLLTGGGLTISEAQDITSWTKFWFTVKTDPAKADANAVLRKDDAGLGGITRLSPTKGVLRVKLLPADTAALINARQTLYCDFQGLDPTGDTYTLARGTLEVLAEVTQTGS